MVTEVSLEVVLRWMPLDLTDDKLTLVQVMAGCRQAISHYMSRCWFRSLSPYGVTRPQWEVFVRSVESYSYLSGVSGAIPAWFVGGYWTGNPFFCDLKRGKWLLSSPHPEWTAFIVFDDSNIGMVHVSRQSCDWSCVQVWCLVDSCRPTTALSDRY